MEKKDILHLGRLARIKIADDEVQALADDVTAVLDYVSIVNEITANTEVTKKVGSVYNVFRDDVVTVPAHTHTEDLLAEAPEVKGRFVAVQKILNTD